MSIAARSFVSNAIFCASITSPATRDPKGIKHQPIIGRPSVSISCTFVAVPWRMRYRLPVSPPITSKYLKASNCARCSGESHSPNRVMPRTLRRPSMAWRRPRNDRILRITSANKRQTLRGAEVNFCSNMTIPSAANKSRKEKCFFG